MNNYDNPGVSILEKFGFHRKGLDGFYESHIKPGVVFTLVFLKGDISVYEEPEDDEQSELEESHYRLHHIQVLNDTELDFMLEKTLK